MSVWLTIPSARPAADVAPVVAMWARMGYKVALWRDEPTPAELETLGADLISTGPYPGYARAVNELIASACMHDAAAEWFVIGGDDVNPDPTKRAHEIAAECGVEFFGRMPQCMPADPSDFTFGVMQPTGDRWGDHERHNGKRGSAYIDRVAGSAWIGREFALQAYGGNGPLWHEYSHMFVDQELQEVAQRLGVFWQRPDLTQHHAHWGRRPDASAAHIPAHLKPWNTPEHWTQSRALFETRQAAGFPGHEPKAAAGAHA